MYLRIIVISLLLLQHSWIDHYSFKPTYIHVHTYIKNTETHIHTYIHTYIHTAALRMHRGRPRTLQRTAKENPWGPIPAHRVTLRFECPTYTYIHIHTFTYIRHYTYLCMHLHTNANAEKKIHYHTYLHACPVASLSARISGIAARPRQKARSYRQVGQVRSG